MNGEFKVTMGHSNENGIVGGTVDIILKVNPREIELDAEKAAELEGLNPYDKNTNEYMYWEWIFLDALEANPNLFTDPHSDIHSIFYYTERAKYFLNTSSNRQLSEALGLANNAVCRWENEEMLPKESAMKKLAELAGISLEQGLLELSYWKADDETKVTYEKLIKQVVNTAASVSLFLLVLLSSSTAFASDKIHSSIDGSIYYQIKIRRFFKWLHTIVCSQLSVIKGFLSPVPV